MAKILSLWPKELSDRDWQKRALPKVCDFKESGKDSFLLDVYPGGGKTRFAIRAAHKFLFLGWADFIIAVVPREGLKEQFANEAYKDPDTGTIIGLNLNPNFTNQMYMVSPEFHGIVITYQQLGEKPELFRSLLLNKRALLIGDEWHHLGEEKAWGDAADRAFSNCIFKLLMTGTPFRSDANKLPFVKYEKNENGEYISKCDFRYTYEESIVDKVNRVVKFIAFDGVMEWKSNNKIKKASFDSLLNDSEVSERLRTALDPKGEWIRHLLSEANGKITELRNAGHADAAGLITCMDQKHARKVAKILTEVTGEIPELIMSEEKDSKENLEMFKKSSRRWIVSVKMISEGTNIPKFRVACYLTNIVQALYFIQFVGRPIRMMKGFENGECYIYIPSDPRILKLAGEIEKERDHALEKLEKSNKWGNNPDWNNFGKNDGPRNFEAISSKATSAKEFEFTIPQKAADLFGLPLEVAEKTATGLENKKIKEAEKAKPDIEKPYFQQLKETRAEIITLSKEYAKDCSDGDIVDWDKPHKEWIELGGKPIEQENLNQLLKRKDWLKKKLAI